MKIFLMSGAYRDAGDFLIVERSVTLLKKVYPNCEIVMHKRKDSVESVLEEVNRCDMMIFAGGPMYLPELRPKQIPVIDDLDKIKIPIYSIGLGWYGKNQWGNLTYDEVIFHHTKFNEPSMALLKRMEKDGNLTCRDFPSMRVLKNNGFQKMVLTGCPAWFDLEFVDRKEVRDDIRFPYKKICISGPGYKTNMKQSAALAEYVANRYPHAKLYYVFHEGTYLNADIQEERINAINETMEQLKQSGAEIVSIPYSMDGFHIYDDCDLHIGYRVHAHIYNLSRRNISVLVEEDGRGNGVDEICGLCGIKPYNLQRDRKQEYEWNPYFFQSIDDYLDILENSNFTQMKVAYSAMQAYFPKMMEHIESLVK